MYIIDRQFASPEFKILAKQLFTMLDTLIPISYHYPTTTSTPCNTYYPINPTTHILSITYDDRKILLIFLFRYYKNHLYSIVKLNFGLPVKI
ncbi:unnamed protein product [Gordionus sp. m RMFG-2023]